MTVIKVVKDARSGGGGGGGEGEVKGCFSLAQAILLYVSHQSTCFFRRFQSKGVDFDHFSLKWNMNLEIGFFPPAPFWL